jgi:hypothetical protein
VSFCPADVSEGERTGDGGEADDDDEWGEGVAGVVDGALLADEEARIWPTIAFTSTDVGLMSVGAKVSGPSSSASVDAMTSAARLLVGGVPGLEVRESEYRRSVICVAVVRRAGISQILERSRGRL